MTGREEAHRCHLGCSSDPLLTDMAEGKVCEAPHRPVAIETLNTVAKRNQPN